MLDGRAELIVTELIGGGVEIDMEGVEDGRKVEDVGVDAFELLRPTLKVKAGLGLGLLSIEAMGSELGARFEEESLSSSLPPARKANRLETLPDVGVVFPVREEEAELDRAESTCSMVSTLGKI